VIIFYNIAANDKAFLDMIGSEMSTVLVSLYPGKDAIGMSNEISKMEGVRKTVNYDYVSVTINDEGSQVMIINDFSLLDTNQLYKGSYPQNKNEVVISGYVAKRFHITIGDMITVRVGNVSAEYLITGLIQSISNIGMNISMRLDGANRLMPLYTFRNVNVYLEKKADLDSFIQIVKERYGSQIKEIIDMKELSKSQLGIYVLIVSIFASIILCITALVISLTLYLIIKALINRRKKDFGIQKVSGYTNYQLMLQT
jgi:putative ABC transport system permease protein